MSQKQLPPARKAGEVYRQGLNHVDQKLANAIVDMFMGKDRMRGRGTGTAAQYLGGTPLSAAHREGTPRGAAYTSAAARYGAPLVAAGIGANIVGGTTNAIFGGPEDGQQPGQLDLGSLTVASLVGGAMPNAGVALTNMYREGTGDPLMTPTTRQRLGVSAASAGATMLANALGQAIF